MAMAHLLELGHRRIQHVAGPLEFFEAAARRHGYEATLAEAGLAPLPLFVGDWTSEAGYRAAATIRRMRRPSSAATTRWRSG